MAVGEEGNVILPCTLDYLSSEISVAEDIRVIKMSPVISGDFFVRLMHPAQRLDILLIYQLGMQFFKEGKRNQVTSRSSRNVLGTLFVLC